MATVEKRGESYRIVASAGYGSDGKQIRKRMTWTPQEGLTARQIEKELTRVTVEFESKVSGGDYLNESKMRLSDFCPKYLEFEKDSLSPTTYSYYQRIIKTLIIPAVGHIKMQDLKPLHVQMFIKNLSADDLCKVTKKERAGDREEKTVVSHKKYAASSIRRYYVVLQSILHSACKLGLIATNPADSDRIDLPPMEPPKTEIFTKKEAVTMLDFLSKEPLMYQVLINLAIVTGGRRGELVALQWPDIDFNGCTVSISKSNYKLKGEEIKTKQPKTTGSIRTVAIPQFMAAMLKDYQTGQKLTRLKLGDQWHNENWIFTQWNGEPMYPTTPTLWFTKFLKRNKLSHKKFHALRHTSATLLLTSGANIKEVGSRLGHTQLSTTNRYVHAVTEADKAAADAFEGMFGDQNNTTVVK
jgi:integrase